MVLGLEFKGEGGKTEAEKLRRWEAEKRRA
jgi:hypothetical protein